MDNDTHARKERLIEELNELGKSITGAIHELKERREQRNNLTQQAQEAKQTRKDLSKVIKDKITVVKDLRQKRGPHVQHAPQGRGEHRESPGKMREEIARLERKIETSGMAYEDEQKLTKILKEKKAQLNQVSGEHNLDKDIRSLSKEIDKLKMESDVAHEIVTKAAKESQEHHEAMLTLSHKVEEWKKRESELREELSKIRDQSAAAELPTKKPSMKKKTVTQHSADEQAILEVKAAAVEQKVKDKKKLTTEDLLAFQAKK